MNIVVIEALTFGLGRLVKAAEKQGYTIILLTRNKQFYTYELSLLESEKLRIVEVDTFSYEKVKYVIESFDHVIGLINMTDTWGDICLKISTYFKFPMQKHAVINLIRNKVQLRNKLYLSGLSKVNSIEIDPKNFSGSVVGNEINYPCIVKDSSGTGSQNVWIAYNQLELRQLIHKAQDIHLRGNLAIEPFITGTLYSIETLSWEGEVKVLALTGRILSNEPYFKEEAFSLPIKLSPNKEKALFAWIGEILLCVGYEYGFAHTEFIMTSKGFEVVEINPRLGGVQIGESLCQIYEDNIYEAWLEMALNKRPALIDK
ncbi:MAG: ATP-grasp domain-containing protein, partial [Candidatus Lariskella arthropodorum]